MDWGNIFTFYAIGDLKKNVPKKVKKVFVLEISVIHWSTFHHKECRKSDFDKKM